MPSSPLLTNPTLRALVAIALFTYTAQNMLNVSIAPLSRALNLPEWIVGAAVSLAAAAVTALSQFWGRRSIAWGRRRVILLALFLALTAAEKSVPAVSARISASRMTRLRPQAIERRPQNWLSAVTAAAARDTAAPTIHSGRSRARERGAIDTLSMFCAV